MTPNQLRSALTTIGLSQGRRTPPLYGGAVGAPLISPPVEILPKLVAGRHHGSRHRRRQPKRKRAA
jgi:hypothetical protein